MMACLARKMCIRDRYLNIRPDCNDKEELYTWKKPNNQVVGILLGKPQVDNYGDVKIVNHITGDYCMVHFKARGWRSSSAYEVKGEVYNKSGGKEWIFGGRWNESVSAKKVLKPNSSEEMQLDEIKRSNTYSSGIPSGGPKYDGTRFGVWHVNDRPEFPFNLTKFAVTLNAPQPRLIPWLPPTDTRLRPDQRAMEEGRYDEAAEEKHRVEEKPVSYTHLDVYKRQVLARTVIFMRFTVFGKKYFLMIQTFPYHDYSRILVGLP